MTKKTLFRYNYEQIKIEVFRLNQKPKSILDFSSGFVDLINEDDITASNLNPTVALIKDYILPNRKYYYMFRTRSSSGLVSNPSPVYELELIKDSDSTEIVATMIPLDEEPGNQWFRKFRRLFQVRPSLNQETLVSNTVSRSPAGRPAAGQGRGARPISNVLDKYTLGDAEESIWGRKFKLRVRSNDSGKVMDFNLNFELTKNKKIEDL